MLAPGVLATLACNVAYGAPHGLSGELLSGWPAVALVGSVEMVLVMVRRARTETETEPAVPLVLAQPAPADSAHAAQLALAASVAAGKPDQPAADDGTFRAVPRGRAQRASGCARRLQRAPGGASLHQKENDRSDSGTPSLL